MSASASRETRLPSDDFEREAARIDRRGGLLGRMSTASSSACLKSRRA